MAALDGGFLAGLVAATAAGAGLLPILQTYAKRANARVETGAEKLRSEERATRFDPEFSIERFARGYQDIATRRDIIRRRREIGYGAVVVLVVAIAVEAALALTSDLIPERASAAASIAQNLILVVGGLSLFLAGYQAYRLFRLDDDGPA